MVALYTPTLVRDQIAPNFLLKSTDGNLYSLQHVIGPNGLVVMFICNHCPYVQAILPKLLVDIKKLQSIGIGAVAIMSNDTTTYPDDSFENMRKLVQQYHFTFPYCIDETQEVAIAYGAVCTPDFFGYDKNLHQQYRGRFDNSGRNQQTDGEHELLNAMLQIARTGSATGTQHPSIGCSIKWKS